MLVLGLGLHCYSDSNIASWNILEQSCTGIGASIQFQACISPHELMEGSQVMPVVPRSNRPSLGSRSARNQTVVARVCRLVRELP